MSTHPISLTINGKKQQSTVESRKLLVHYLRDDLGLTGTHIGCDTSQCGACVVHLDGLPVKSCTLLAPALDGATLLTIEGLHGAPGSNQMHPMQEAFREHHGLQCGFCTPGMLMTAVALATEKPDLSEADVRHGLEGNICRCTGYQNIVVSVMAGAAAMNAARGE